jgi:hypothetical protein
MSEYKEGYKVVSSGLRSSTDLACTVRYSKTKWAVPPVGCGPLTVFDCVDAAKSFYYWITAGYRPESHKLYRCLYIPSSAPVAAVWHQESMYEEKLLPRGTKLADAVLLTERVDSDE